MNRHILLSMAAFGLAVCPVVGTSPAFAQTADAPDPQRDATREALRSLLATAGARNDVAVDFRQSTKNPYNFVGVMKTGLSNADAFEIVIGVSKQSTIGFRIYPHYKGAYINLLKARAPRDLMLQLLNYSDTNFLFWGADDSRDVFAGYTFTLESGFPTDAMMIVIRSIRNLDKYVGEMRPSIDGTAAPAS